MKALKRIGAAVAALVVVAVGVGYWVGTDGCEVVGGVLLSFFALVACFGFGHYAVTGRDFSEEPTP